MIRQHNRRPDEMRPVSLERHYTRHAEGSVLVAFGDTRVLCNATVEDRVPGFLYRKKRGWVTAEYSMLPRSTGSRTAREAVRGKQSGRTQEIQRLIARSLRAAIDPEALGERTITVDCDVIQADGGTRTASITGGFVALADAVGWMLKRGRITSDPLIRSVASVSVGICGGTAITDLDYNEDSQADADMNVVMDDAGNFIEVQGTAELQPFSRELLDAMLRQAETACSNLFEIQRDVLSPD